MYELILHGTVNCLAFASDHVKTYHSVEGMRNGRHYKRKEAYAVFALLWY